MKTKKIFRGNEGSVLMVSMLTITILTLICATSLYITSQNTNAAIQTAAWQQSLAAAESGVDQAVRALNASANANSGAWTNWRSVSTTLPSSGAGYNYEATGGTAISSSTTSPPSSSQYYYLPSSNLTIPIQGEAGSNVTVSAWVTVDTAGPTNLLNGTQQWYRIRSTGQTVFQNSSVLTRVTNNKLDNALRNTLALAFNRDGSPNPNLGPTRTIEVIMEPINQGGGARGITLANWLVMSGSGSADSVNNGVRDTTYPLLVAEGNPGNTGKFNQNNVNYVYGGMVYNGATVPPNTNSTTVLGGWTSPDGITIPTTADPSQSNPNNYTWSYTNPWYGGGSPWSDSASYTTSSFSWTSNGGGGGSGTYPPASGTYATLTGGGGLPTNGGTTVSSATANGTATAPELIIINGDFTMSNTFTVNPTMTGPSGHQVASPSNSYLIIWVKGQLKVQGSGQLVLNSGTHLAIIADNDITISGSGVANNTGVAANLSIIQVGNNHKVTDSGSANFIGTINAPGAAGTLSGSGDYTGAIVSSNLTISGQGSFHYDEALGGTTSQAVGNYAFASWFEDNADPNHNLRNLNNGLFSNVY
jgi:hypothetical protein